MGRLGSVGGLRRKRGTKASVEWPGLAAAGGCHNLFEVYELPFSFIFPLKSSLPLPFVSSCHPPPPLSPLHPVATKKNPKKPKTLGRSIYTWRLKLRPSIPLARPEDSHNPPPVTITANSSLWLLADVWNLPNFATRLTQ